MSIGTSLNLCNCMHVCVQDLRVLDLGCTGGGPMWAKVVAQTLLHGYAPMLEDLCFKQNMIEDEGARYFAEVIDAGSCPRYGMSSDLC